MASISNLPARTNSHPTTSKQSSLHEAGNTSQLYQLKERAHATEPLRRSPSLSASGSLCLSAPSTFCLRLRKDTGLASLTRAGPIGSVV